MAKECKTYIDAVSTMAYHDRKHEKKESKFFGFDYNLDLKDRKLIEKVMITLGKMFKKSTVYKEAQIEDAIRDLWGSKKARQQELYKLMRLLDSHPGIKPIVMQRLMEQLRGMEARGIEDQPLVGKKGKEKREDYWLEWEDDKGVRDLNWSTIPLPILRGTYNFAQRIALHGTGENIGKGRIGKLIFQHTTPRKLSQKERSGALFQFDEAMNKFPQEQGRWVKMFTHGALAKEGGRKWGWVDIVKGIHRLSMHESLKGKKFRDSNITLMDMFIKYLFRDQDGNRALRINKDGTMEVATASVKTGRFYKATGDPIMKYDRYQSAESYFGKKHIPFNDDMIQLFLNEAARYDKLHAELWEVMIEEFAQTREQLYGLLRRFVPDHWTDDDIVALFFSKDPTTFKLKNEDGKVIRSFEDLGEKQQQMVQFIHENASSHQILKPFMFNSVHVEGDNEQGRASFPVTYGDFKFPWMWDIMLDSFQKELKDVNRSLENPALDDQTRNKLRLRKKKLTSTIKRSAWVRDRMDGYPVDIESGTRVMLGADSKHMEHISGAFNVLHGRTDKGAYVGYLRHNFAQLERARLAIEYIESLVKAESQQVRDIVTSWYKVTMYQPDAISGLGPFNFSTEAVSKRLEKWNIQIPTDIIDDFVRAIVSYFGGSKLRGWGTAFQNYTAVQEKLYGVGPAQVVEAYEIIRDGGQDLERIIAASGVVDFREFFSESLTNDAQVLGAENKQILDMMGHMAKYWKMVDMMEEKDEAHLKKTGKHLYTKKQKAGLKKKYKKDMQDEMQGVFDELQEDFDILHIIPDKDRLAKRRRKFRLKHANNLLRKYVNYAINKQYEMAPYVRNPVWKATLTAVEWWGAIQAEHFPTMGKTETELRTLSFIIGVRRAMKIGIITDKRLVELTGQEFEIALEWGRKAARDFDFGLSRQSIGAVAHSNIGAGLTQFKVWPMQKFSVDIDKIQHSIDQMKDDEAKGHKKLRIKKYGIDLDFTLYGDVLKKIWLTRKVPIESLRIAAPDIARARMWLFWQGAWTMTWELAILGPLAMPALRQVASRLVPMSNPFFRAVGGSTSDLISLIMAPVTISFFLAAGEGEDNWDKLVDYFLNKTILGLSGRLLVDGLLAVMVHFTELSEEKKEQRTVRPIKALLPPGGEEAYELMDWLRPKK